MVNVYANKKQNLHIKKNVITEYYLVIKLNSIPHWICHLRDYDALTPQIKKSAWELVK